MEAGRGSLCEAERATVSFPRTQQIAAGAFVGLAVFCIFQACPIKPLSTPIKLADGVVKGVKFLRGPRSASHLVVFASKALLKGYKASKRLELIKGKTGSTSFDVGRLKAFLGALNLARYALAPPVGGVLGLNLLNVGYKASKNFVKVLEGFVGVQLDSSFRKGIEALGLFVRTMSLSREFARIAELGVAQKFQNEGGIPHGASTCRLVGKPAPHQVIRRVRDGGRLAPLVHLPLQRSEKGLSVEEYMDFSVSELFSLSIPLQLTYHYTCKYWYV